MPLDIARLAFERFLVQRARQRSGAIARAKEIAKNTLPQVGTPDVTLPAPLRRYNATAVRRLLARGKRRGYVSFQEVNDILPASEISVDDIESVLMALYELDIELCER